MSGPLLLNLNGCGRCGVERRFRLLGGVLRCTECGLPLNEAALAAPIGPPSSPTALLTSTPPGTPGDVEPSAGSFSHSRSGMVPEEISGRLGPLSASETPVRGTTFKYGDPW